MTWRILRMVAVFSAMCGLLVGAGAVHALPIAGVEEAPALPTTFVDTSLVPSTGQTIQVGAGGDLQAALNSAQPGDVVSIAPGATFVGNFTLPKKAGDGWITVRSAAPDESLALPGTRVTPAQAAAMPKLISPNSAPTVTAAPGAQGYRLIGLDVSVAPSVNTIVNIVAFGGEQTSLADTPRNLIIDRSYIHGQPQTNTFRGVLLNSAQSAVIDSHVSEIHVNGFDSQAILGFNGPGPFKIVNNRLEASGENIMFGGADPKTPGPLAGRHRDPEESSVQAAVLESRRPLLRGHRMDGQEPARAEERTARADRREPAREQLAAVSERCRGALHAPESGRHRALFGRARRDVHEQSDTQRDRRNRDAGLRRREPEPAAAARARAEQPIGGASGKRSCSWWGRSRA